MPLGDFNLDAVNSLLVSEAGRISPDIHTKTLNTSAWLNLMDRGSWSDEMGDIINVLTWERSLPSALTWTAVNLQAANNVTNCAPTTSEITFAQTIRNYGLAQTAIETPMICVTDLRFPVKRKEQLTAMFNILKDNTKWAWENRFRDEYTRISAHKITATIGLPESATEFNIPGDPTKISVPSQGILDRVYMRMNREGASPWGMENGRPIYAAIMSPEAQQYIVGLGQPATTRTDFQYSSRVNELLGPLGVERAYRGFYHIMDMFPNRYNLVDDGGGLEWVKVEPYVAVAATNGTKFDLNPLYDTAEYEDLVIYDKTVMRTEFPKPITSPGGNTKFDPVNYMGDFQWINVKDVNKTSPTYNPDGTKGFFRGVLSAASKPIDPNLGTVIRFRRGAANLGLVDPDGEPITA